ncbi:beta-L-arabinofuranosidase domain-containing protein [Telmatobacter bradus]|uniref:glycoside hydrolase family 127 protein n=1 Tax=Telmatobacter bradus TaxID=474953 RepID=UPI003B431023
MGDITRRGFMQSASAVTAAGLGTSLLGIHGFNALAQDPVSNTERSANHSGYEIVPWKIRPFPMRQVHLLDGPLRQARERNLVYLYMLPNDRLLHSFRLTAGRHSSAQPLGGWEAPDCELRGHFSGGHYLSACALAVAATGDEQIRQKADALVDELAKCQREDGYLGAYPASYYDRLRKGERIWAPFYTYHKIMAGLLDMYVHCGNLQALSMCERMADWATRWIEPIPQKEWARIQLVEHGGMNEVCFNLYAVTGERRFRNLGFRFEHRAFFDPLAAGVDRLSSHHANTNIPKVIGAARGYELSGDRRYHSIAENFWQMVAEHHAYCTGGTGSTVPLSSDDGEGWHTANNLANQLVPAAEECCCSYNMMKLSRHLFGWTSNARYMDYYERLLWNVRLGTQDPHGMLMYYVPMQPGNWKTFGTAYDSFWCCTGTGVEEYAKISDTLYFHDEHGIYVNQFAASEVEWPERGLRLTQHTQFPHEESTSLHIHAVHPVRMALHIRAPYWCPEVSIRINGRPEPATPHSNGYIELERVWQQGDRIDVLLPMRFHPERLPGNSSVQAMMYGPLVLAGLMGRDGLTTEMIYGPTAPAHTGKFSSAILPRLRNVNGAWVEKTHEPLRFRTAGQLSSMELKPLYQVMDERYTVYWQVNGKA